MDEMMDVRMTFCDEGTAVYTPRFSGFNAHLETLFKGNSNRWLPVHNCMFSKENALGGRARGRSVSVKAHGQYKWSAFIFLLTSMSRTVDF